MGTLNKLDLTPIIGTNDLEVLLFPSQEGVSENTSCDVYYGEIGLVDLDLNFDVEQNSDKMDERYKLQRDVDAPRIKGMTNYLKNRSDYTFPTLSIFVTSLDQVTEHNLCGKTVVSATLSRSTERLLADGQGRLSSIKSMLPELPQLHRHGIGFKLYVTNTKSIYDAETVIKQVFSDINANTKKPSTSLFLYFDSSEPFPRLLNEIIDTDFPIGGDGEVISLSQILSKQGTLKKGQLWLYRQFSAFFCLLFGVSESELNKQLSDEDVYAAQVEVGRTLVVNVLKNLPIEILWRDDWKAASKQALFTKALFARGLGHLCQCLIAESARTGKLDWDKLNRLSELPISDISDDFWFASGVTEEHLNSRRIVRGCDKRIARVLCYELDIKPTLNI